jgi:hypothetical protein
MKKSLVFTKSIAFEKTLIDRLEEYLSTIEKDNKRVNFSGEVSGLIEAGLKYKQIEHELASGKRSKLGQDAVLTTGKAKLEDLIKNKVEFEETAMEQPKPVRGVRINKI